MALFFGTTRDMYIFLFCFFFLLNVIDSLKLKTNFQKCMTIPFWNKYKNPMSVTTLSEEIGNSNSFFNNRFFRNELTLFNKGFNLFRKKYHERSIEEKLSTIPVYIISNYSNSPYIFQQNEKQVCYLFVCPYDAEEMLEQLITNNSVKETKNIKIHSIHMGKAYELIKELIHLKSLEHTDEHIKRNMVYWKLIPSKKQVQNSLIHLSFKEKSDFIFPVFYIDGVYIKKDKENIIPLFLSMEDLKSTFEKQCKGRSFKKCNIKVLNLVDLMFSENHKYFGFVPSSESIEYAKKLKRIGIRKTYL